MIVDIISNYNVYKQSYQQNTMSLSKPPSAKKRREMQTTMSANVLTKSKTNLQKLLRPKVSPFEIQSHPQSILIHQSKQLKAVQDINYQYIQLFVGLFQGNKDINGEVGPMVGRLSREQRYQMECMKILKKTSANVDKLTKIRGLCQSWELIAQYLANHKNKQLKFKSEYLNQTANLIKNYKQLSAQLKQIQQKHEELFNKNIANTQQLQRKDQSKLSELERQFRRNQRKLNKIMDQQKYYERKCMEQQVRLQQFQFRIKKIQGNKLDIDMRIIGEEEKRNRLMRKTREKRQKSLVPTPVEENKPQKMTRSKSSVRYQTKNL